MSKKKHDEEEVIVDIGGSYNQAEQFIENNKQTITSAVIAVLVVVGGYFGYAKLYVEPLELEASDQIWKAQSYFDQDSLDLAMYGDGNYMGFEEIADEYGATKTGAMANYYMGVISLRKGNYDEAIDYLNNYNGDDVMISAVALGATGDAYMELDNPDEAMSFYVKASQKNANEFTSALYLMKAGKVAEALGDYNVAVGFYNEIKTKYPDTKEGKEVEKYLMRAKTLAAS